MFGVFIFVFPFLHFFLLFSCIAVLVLIILQSSVEVLIFIYLPFYQQSFIFHFLSCSVFSFVFCDSSSFFFFLLQLSFSRSSSLPSQFSYQSSLLTTSYLSFIFLFVSIRFYFNFLSIYYVIFSSLFPSFSISTLFDIFFTFLYHL